MEINFSSLSLINDCMRKAEYGLFRKLRSENEPEALTGGKAVHKALEHWYSLPQHLRLLTPEEDELADALIAHPLNEPSIPYETALDSINEYVKAARPLQWLAAEDKRSIFNGIKILKAYFKHYSEDGLEVLKDEAGKPYIERECSYQIYEDDKKVIVLFGTIDVIFKNLITGQILPGDHKTTASLGSQFYNRIKPNHQYTAYLFLARNALGLDVNSFMVNGIQVAKTKSEFARQITERTDEDFEELKLSLVDATEKYLQAIERDKWPMMAPNSCSSYGACQYYEICSSPKALRETVIKGKFGDANA